MVFGGNHAKHCLYPSDCQRYLKLCFTNSGKSTYNLHKYVEKATFLSTNCKRLVVEVPPFVVVASVAMVGPPCVVVAPVVVGGLSFVELLLAIVDTNPSNVFVPATCNLVVK